MGLIKCPDCGKDISDSAPVCPNCGRPMKVEVQQTIKEPKKIIDVPEGYKEASNPYQGYLPMGIGIFIMILDAFYFLSVIIDYSSKINASGAVFIIPTIVLAASAVLIFFGYSKQAEITYYECPNCEYFGKNTKTVIKGSGCLEVFLWLFFIIPGIIYSIYRSMSVSKKACPKCEYTHLKQWKLEKLLK